MSHPYTYELLARDRISQAQTERLSNQRIARQRPARPGLLTTLSRGLGRMINAGSSGETAKRGRSLSARDLGSL
jgi:hypothetical protein